MPLKYVLVTGATRGLGLSIAERLIADGFYVIASGRTMSEKLQKLIDSNSGRISFNRLDLANAETIYPFMQDLGKQYPALYGLVNNAAVAHEGVLATMHDSQIAEVIVLNLINTILLTKYACRSMLLKGEGRIINISSIIGLTGFNGLSVYGASKAGLIGFSKSLARELGKANITVNVVAPGYMQTDMSSSISEENLQKIIRRSPMNKLVTTQEVSAAVGYLLGEDAKSVTGIVLPIDGGSIV